MMQPEAIVQKMMKNDAFSQWLGIKILQVKPGSCTLTMQVRKEMLNGFGIAHGGIAYSLADSALAFASNSQGNHAVSIDTSIKYVDKLQAGDNIVATAVEESKTHKFGYYRITIMKEAQIVALFHGTVYRKKITWETTK